jgi:Cytochrome P460
MTGLIRPKGIATAAAAALLLITWVACAGFSQARSTGFPLTYVDSQGDIARPTGFREKWTHLGTWFVKDAKGPGYAVHDVYTQPGVAAAYRKTGQFPDGAVLVKEVRKARSAQMTTGQVSWAEDLVLWFVMVKDQQGRFKGNPHWGNGWGWALFNADAPSKDVSTNFQKDCIPCHVPAKNTGWVYIQGYPTLGGALKGHAPA